MLSLVGVIILMNLIFQNNGLAFFLKPNNYDCRKHYLTLKYLFLRPKIFGKHYGLEKELPILLDTYYANILLNL
nr:MAG TPA: hypothetical protein [Caudoviricetes sp.]